MIYYYISFILSALFVQNAVFSRALGASRVFHLSGHKKRDILTFGTVLTAMLTISAPIIYVLNGLLKSLPQRTRNILLPTLIVLVISLLYVLFFITSVVIEEKLFSKLKLSDRTKNTLSGIKYIMAPAAFNCALMGSVLASIKHLYGFWETLFFNFASGVSFTLAVIVLTASSQYLESEAIPRAFRGLPAKLLFIGLVSLALYGLTGHETLY